MITRIDATNEENRRRESSERTQNKNIQTEGKPEPNKIKTWMTKSQARKNTEKIAAKQGTNNLN